MGDPISCNYARAAIHHFTTKYQTRAHKLPRGSYSKILQDYNHHFADTPTLKTTYTVVSNKFQPITRIFARKWNPNAAKQTFITTFSPTSWGSVDHLERPKHTLHGCKVCTEKYEMLSQSFPLPSHVKQKSKSPQIAFSPNDLSSPRQFGSKLLVEANSLTQSHFQKPIQQVLEETPRSKLVIKPNHTKRLSQKRKLLREIKNEIQSDMNTEGDTLVLQNRISWNRFDSLRKSQGLRGTKRNRAANENEEDEPPPKRQHAGKPENLAIDKDQLLQEARSWNSDEKVNWSQVGRRYGLSSPNCGQAIKEYLAQEGIPAACVTQRTHRAPRRSKKRLSGGKVSFPMYHPVKTLKQKVTEKIETGEIKIGKKVVQTRCPRYSAQGGELLEESSDVYARKIPLSEIQQTLLKTHEELGILRVHPDEYYATLPEETVKTTLARLHEKFDPDHSVEDLRDQLKHVSRHRLLKVWHDHSGIGGHSHLLVLVAAVYDPAIFFTPEEMKQKGAHMDVPTIVEEPQVHILGRSTSSLDDQVKFIDCRKECLVDLSENLFTQTGIPIHDVVRFFHGDGPAVQFEAGNKVGGNYSCAGCDAHTSRFNDLAYCFRAHRPTLAERQDFILKGDSWKHSTINPLDKLRVADLRRELEKRGVDTRGKKKPELERELEELKKGISNVPAILQTAPQATLDSLNLGSYEVYPSEPLHDLKGHLRNIIEEATKIANGETDQVLKRVQNTVLDKCTLRCSDYRKATIIILQSLQQCEHPQPQILELFRTAVEIGELLYAPESKRTPKAILRLHNLAYQHGRICRDLFSTSNNTSIFGRYFHSLSCHSPLLLRIISLRSVNTEVQERMFGQAKQITKTTSCLRANHIIENILIRIHEEGKAQTDPLAIQEGEIHRLAQTLAPSTNTLIPYSWLTSNSTLHQAHLERISDFLVPGPGVWWRQGEDGIEFLDGYDSPSEHPEGPDIHHVRSTSLSDIDYFLQVKWEECCSKQILLPAYHIRHYGSDGSLSTITGHLETSSPPTQSQQTSDPPSHSLRDSGPPETPTVSTRGSDPPESHTVSTTGSDPPESPIPSTRGSGPPESPTVSTTDSDPPFQYQHGSSPTRHVQLETPQQVFKTTLANTISQVLPSDVTLRQFDLLRSRKKQTKRAKTKTRGQLTEISQQLKEALIAKYKELSTTVKLWESAQKHLQCHVSSAGPTHKPKHIQDSIHKMNITRKVLRHEWKMTDEALFLCQ